MSREIVWKGHRCLWLFHLKKNKSKSNSILNHSLILKKNLILYIQLFPSLSATMHENDLFVYYLFPNKYKKIVYIE